MSAVPDNFSEKPIHSFSLCFELSTRTTAESCIFDKTEHSSSRGNSLIYVHDYLIVNFCRHLPKHDCTANPSSLEAAGKAYVQHGAGDHCLPKGMPHSCEDKDKSSIEHHRYSRIARHIDT